MACTNLEGARCLFDLFLQKSSNSFSNYTPQDLTNANRLYNDGDDDNDNDNDNDEDIDNGNDNNNNDNDDDHESNNNNNNNNGNTKICCFRTENCVYSS